MPLWKNVKRHFSNSEHRTMIKEGLLNVPKSLYQALPAVLLGVLFNALDAGAYRVHLAKPTSDS